MGRVSRVAKPRRTQSQRAGLIFPVARFKNKIKLLPQAAKRVTKGAGAYLTAVIEYLCGILNFYIISY